VKNVIWVTHLAMYVSRFVVVSMTRLSIEIGMKGCDFHCRGARVNFGVWDCSRKAGRWEDGKCYGGDKESLLLV